MSTITAQDQASTTTAAERGRARALAAMTEVKAPAGYRALTAAEAADTRSVDGELELIAGVGLVVKLPEPTEAPADLVADLEATDELQAEQLADKLREAVTANREAGVQVGRYTSGTSSRPQLDQAQERADQATAAMWRAFYDYASR